jgi:hypothetical protein
MDIRSDTIERSRGVEFLRSAHGNKTYDWLVRIVSSGLAIGTLALFITN